MYGRKGQGKVALDLLILILVILVLFFFVTRLGSWIESKSTIETCKVSVIGATQFGKGTGYDLVSPGNWELECPPSTIVIEEDEYEVNGLERPYRHDVYEENVKQVFADQMVECWYKFGEGDLDAFDDDLFFGFSNICFPCAHIQFDNAPTTEVEGMEDFLKDTFMTGAWSPTSTTYWDYMYRYYDVGEGYRLLFKESSESIFIPYGGYIPTNEEYEIVFLVKGLKLEVKESVGLEKRAHAIFYYPVNDRYNLGSTCDYWYE
jgi:hypothetical protein